MQITVRFDSLEEMKEFVEEVRVGKSVADAPVSVAQVNPDPVPDVQTAGVPAAPAVPTGGAPVTGMPTAPVAPAAAGSPVVATAPVTQPAAPSVSSVPTSTRTYTPDDLARAAMALMDSGRQNELIGLLAQFGVSSIPELKGDQLGAFATALRGMGAQI